MSFYKLSKKFILYLFFRLFHKIQNKYYLTFIIYNKQGEKLKTKLLLNINN